MKYKSLIRLSGLILFIWLCARIDPAAIFAVMLKADPVKFACAFLIGLAAMSVRVVRWMVFLEFYNIRISFFHACALMLVGNSYGSMTPGRIGEAVRPYYLHQQGYNFMSALKTAVADRLWDFFLLMIFGAASLYFFICVQHGNIQVRALPLIVFFIAAAILVTAWKPAYTIAKNIIKKVSPEKFKKLFSGDQEHADGRTFGSLLFFRVWKVAGLSIVAVVVTYAKFYLLSGALNQGLSFVFVTLAISLVMMVRLLPVTFLNIGSREAVLVYMLGLKGLSAVDAMAYSFLILADMLLLILLGQALAWICFPRIFREVKEYEITSGGAHS